MAHKAYENYETLDFEDWAKRHKGIRNDMGRACKVFDDYPALMTAVRSFKTGSKDLRAAVDKVVPGGKRGDSYEQNVMHLQVMDIVIAAWRKYQNYLRAREDIKAPERYVALVAEFEAAQGGQDGPQE